jgi:hypothetical protein
MLYLSGSVNGKWHNFGGFATPGTRRDGWKKLEWKKYEMTVTVPDGGIIKSLNISIINHVTGTVMLDGISIRDYDENEKPEGQNASKSANIIRNEKPPAPKIMFRSVKPGNLFRKEEIPELEFELGNPAAHKLAIHVKFKTSDYFGRIVRKSEKDFTLKEHDSVREVLRYPDFTRPGFYSVTAEWQTERMSGCEQASFVKVGNIPKKLDPLFGSNFSTGFPINAEFCELMGIGAVGWQFSWDSLLKRTEKYAVPSAAEEYRKRGIEIIGGYLMHYGKWSPDYWKRWMPKGKVKGKEPTIEELKAVLAPLIEENARLYKPYIRTWFLGGEVESGYQRFPNALKNYIGMTIFTAEAIRKGNNDSDVLGIGIGGFKSYPIFPFMPKVLPHVKDYIDGIAPDIYPVGQTYGKGYITANTEEAGFRSGMLQLAEMAKVSRKHWIACAESGPAIIRSTPLDHNSGMTMANIQARQFILLKTIPKMRHWLYFRMGNWDRKSTIDWGMWEKENPRQVVSAYAATARIMAFAQFVKELPIHQDIPCWIFRKDGQYFAAVWYNGKENLKVKLTDGISTEAKDVQGNPIDLKDRTIDLGEAPVYLYAQDTAALEKLLKNAAADVPELAFEVDRQKAGKTILTVKNLSGHKIDLELKKADIPGGQTIQYTDRFPLVSGEVRTIEKPIGADSVTFHLETGKGRKYTVSGDLKTVKVPFVNSFAELERKAVPQLLNDPVRQIAAYDDLKAHSVYTGLDDLSAAFRLGYDRQYLYLEVRVKDDVHMNSNSPGKLYNGDSIQFAVDTLRDAKMKLMRGIKGYSNDDFNFVSGLVKGKPATWCFSAPPEKRSAMLEQPYRLNPEIIRDEKTKTTLYRIKLAFADLAPLKPEKGRNFGFSLIVFDKDTPTSFYHMDLTPGVSHPFDPAKYPAFQFE